MQPLVTVLKAHELPPTTLKFNPPATLLVSGSADNTIRLIDLPVNIGVSCEYLSSTSLFDANTFRSLGSNFAQYHCGDHRCATSDRGEHDVRPWVRELQVVIYYRAMWGVLCMICTFNDTSPEYMFSAGCITHKYCSMRRRSVSYWLGSALTLPCLPFTLEDRWIYRSISTARMKGQRRPV